MATATNFSVCRYDAPDYADLARRVGLPEGMLYTMHYDTEGYVGLSANGKQYRRRMGLGGTEEALREIALEMRADTEVGKRRRAFRTKQRSIRAGRR